MKRIVLALFILLAVCDISHSAVVTSAYVSADDVTVTQLEQNRVIITNALNSADGGLIQDGTVTTAKLDANANPENRWNEGFNDFVYTGLTIPTSASLVSTTASGTLYMNGVRVVKDATSHTYTASKHTYVDLSDNGTFTYSEVAINAAEPTVATNSLRLARVSTDATTVLSVRDDRVTTITLAAGSAGSIADTDADTKIQTEEAADEDILRMDTAGVERWIMTASGERTMPTQPAFLVKPTATQTDIATGSAVTIVFGTEIKDQSNDFATNTFTAPVTGMYQLNIVISLASVDTAAGEYSIVITTSNRNYLTTMNPLMSGDFSFFSNAGILADMDALDTAIVTIEQTGGTAQTDIGSSSFFSGFLAL